MYDLKKDKLKETNFLKAFAFSLHIFLFNKLDQFIVKNRFKKIFAQSKNVQKRVKKYYGINSNLIYDPVDTKKYYVGKFEDFYLTISRLFPEKRVEMIVDAFLEMPEKKLVIVGDGPEKEKIIKKINTVKNITLLNNVNEKKLLKLYSTCLATIYLPKDEDYGLMPLESMAAGKPCIGSNEGGCKETIVNGKTGILIIADKKQLVNAIKAVDLKLVKKMKQACINQAKKFDSSIIFNKWGLEINKLI